MHSRHIPHGSVKLLISQGRRVRGGALDFWGFLSKVGDVIQSGIDTIAPLTAKLAGPVASAVTGLPITPILSAVQSATTKMPQSPNINVSTDVLPLLQQIMNRGVSTAGKGFNSASTIKTKAKKGKGINIL